MIFNLINYLHKSMKPKFYLIKKPKIIEIFIIITIFSISLKLINKSNNDLLIELTNIYNNNKLFFDKNKHLNESISYLLSNTKITKIEKIFIIISLIPFLKSNKIKVKNRNKIINKLIRTIIPINKFKYKNIKKNNYKYYQIEFNDLLYYKWDKIPKINLINNVRSIINNYYSELYLTIFDKSLNLNLKYYIKDNYKKLSSKDIKNLLSKICLF